MKNQISFMSELFDSKALIPAVDNDRHFGEDLAKWMIIKSEGSEFVFGTPVKSADGWCESVSADGEIFVLGFGIVEDNIGDEYAGWTITIGNQGSWKPFGSKDSPQRSWLCDHIHNVLRDERYVREVQWS